MQARNQTSYHVGARHDTRFLCIFCLDFLEELELKSSKIKVILDTFGQGSDVGLARVFDVSEYICFLAHIRATFSACGLKILKEPITDTFE